VDVRIGDLKKRITLQSVSETPDAMGGMTQTWSDVAEVWAAIWPASAREYMAAQSNVMSVSHRIRIRYRSDITSAWRIYYSDAGKYYNIVGIIDPNMRHWVLDLMCLEAA
jgi:SPP1 family predicted phage head-tail adaptor